MTSTLRRSVLVVLVTSFADPVLGVEPGDVLVVTADAGADLRRGDRVVETLPRGNPVRVRRAEGDRLYVETWAGVKDWIPGERGWVDRPAVAPPQDAVDRFTDAIDRKQTAVDLVARALARTATGDREKAIDDLTEAARLEPGHAAAHLYRGAVLQLAGEPEKGFEDHREALRLAPDWYLPHVVRGLRVWAEPRFAYKDFTKAIELAPGRATLHFLRGVAAGKGLAVDRAAADFDEAVRLDPEFADAYALRGFNRVWTTPPGESRAETHEKAIADVDEAIRLDPAEPRFRSLRDKLLEFRQNLRDEAASRPPVEAERP